MPSKIDLHMHSTASDGTDSPAQLAEKVKAAGISVFALTDHDTVSGAEKLKKHLPDGVTFIPGIEFSCVMPSGKCHILGFNCDTDYPAFRAALDKGAELRREKLERRLDFLREHGIQFPDEELELLRQMPSVGKPHLGNLMVKYGFAASKDEAIKDVINQCHTGTTRIGAETAVKAILASGGIPVWAHPLGGTGEKEVGSEQFMAMLTELLSYGLKGLECWYSIYPAERCRWLAHIAKENGLLVSGGSDYHGKNKTVTLGTLNADGEEVSSEIITLLDAILH